MPVESSLQKISAASFIFQLALAVFCVAQIINMSELYDINIFATIASILSYCALGFLLIKILLLTRFTLFEIVIFLVFTVIALLSAYNHGTTEVVYFALFIIGAKGTNARTICKTVLSIIVSGIIIIILLSIIGLLGNRTTYHENGLTGEDVYRQAFGFYHYNNIGRLSLVAFVCYLYLRYKKFGIIDICITLIWAALLYFVVTTKTAPIIMIIATILVLLSKVIHYNWFIGICVVICCIVILASLLLAYFYDPANTFMAQLDSWFTGRLGYAHICFINFPITFFGQSANVSSYNVILDNGYVSLLIRFGLFTLIAVLITYIVAFIEAFKNHNTPLIILLTIMLIMGFAETWLYTTVGLVVLTIAFGVNQTQQPVIDSRSDI